MTTIVNANKDLVDQQKADQEAVEAKKAENDDKLAEICVPTHGLSAIPKKGT